MYRTTVDKANSNSVLWSDFDPVPLQRWVPPKVDTKLLEKVHIHGSKLNQYLTLAIQSIDGQRVNVYSYYDILYLG